MDVNELIERLMAIECYAKDIHYTCSGSSGYAKHLLADLIHDGIDNFIDSLKENVIMGQRELPLASKEYMKKAVEFIPDIREGKDRENFISLNGLIDDTRRLLKEIKVNSRGANSLFDSIGEHLDKCSGLLYLQTRLTEGLNESKEDNKLENKEEVSKTEGMEKIDTKSTATEEIKVEHDHKANTETPVDRKEFKQEIQQPSPAQKTALKYDAENLLVAEEETPVDKLYNKVKELGL